MSAQAIQPESLGQYLLLVLRGLPRQLGLGLLLRVLVVAPISAAALLLHTWLLVYFNEGVNSDGSFLSQSLALSGFRLLTGTLLWTVAAYLLSTLISDAIRVGPLPLLRSHLRVPGWISTATREGGTVGIAVLAGAYALAEILGSVVATRPLTMVMFLSMWMALAAGPQGTAQQVVQLGWRDIQRALHRAPGPSPRAPLVMLQVGIGFGLLRASLLPYQPAMGLCGGVAMLFVAAMLSRAPGGRAAALLLLCMVFAPHLAWADDGGWQEGGGSFTSWLGSEGATSAVLHGLPPAVGVFLGGFFGSFPELFPPITLPEDPGVAPKKPFQYWGDGSKENPFTDRPPGSPELPPGWSGEGTTANPYTDQPKGEDAEEEEPPNGDTGAGGTSGDGGKTGDGASQTGSGKSPNSDGAGQTGDGKKQADGNNSDEEDEDPEEEDDDDEEEDEEDEEDEDEEDPPPPSPPQLPPELTPEQIAALNTKFQEIIDAKVKEGYFVRNPGLIKKAWNNTIGRAQEAWGGYKGGQCGEFGEWGQEWSGPAIKDLFGPNARVDTIYVEEKSTANPKGWMDAADGVVEQNHRATRIILPNGQRFVMDYWESMGRGGGKGQVLSESEWIKKWNKEIGSDFIAQVGHNENSPDMASVKSTMEAPTMQGKSDEYKLKVLEQSMGTKAKTYFNTWKRSPW